VLLKLGTSMPGAGTCIGMGTHPSNNPQSSCDPPSSVPPTTGCDGEPFAAITTPHSQLRHVIFGVPVARSLTSRPLLGAQGPVSDSKGDLLGGRWEEDGGGGVWGLPTMRSR